MHNRSKLFINGLWEAIESDRYIEVVNPASEAVIGRVPAAGGRACARSRSA